MGWVSENGAWYYYNGSTMVKGWQKSGSSWYFLDTTSGKMRTGWVNDGSNTYYMNTSGAMLGGWQQIDGLWYLFGSSGAMVKKAWSGNYYLDKDGVMVTNAYVRNGTSYHWVNASGKYTKTYGSKDSPGYTVFGQSSGSVEQ